MTKEAGKITFEDMKKQIEGSQIQKECLEICLKIWGNNHTGWEEFFEFFDDKGNFTGEKFVQRYKETHSNKEQK